MAATTSLSKGCFVFKEKSKHGARSPRKKGKLNILDDDVDYSVFRGDSKASAQTRYENYKAVWSAIKSASEAIITQSHQQLLNDIKTFVSEIRNQSTAAIPTALVSLGVNLPDHHTFFSLLESMLKSSTSPLIASLSSKECLTLKHMVKKTVQKLLGATSEEEVEDNGDVQSSRSSSKQTFTALPTWYETKGNKNIIIIILQDLEMFNSQHLQDFILLCREYRVQSKLPFVFVMGVATTVTLQQQLHHRTSVCLLTKSFQSQPSVLLLNQLIEELFMDKSPLKIGPRLMQLLMDAFLYHDLSLSSFMQRVHLIVLQHYMTLPSSTICCSSSDIAGKIQELPADDLDLYRQLPSFMKLIERDRSKVSLLKDDKQFRQFLNRAVKDIEDHATVFAFHCKMLHCISQGLPGSLFGRALREVYLFVLSETATSSTDWTQFVKLLSLSSAQELKNRMEAILDTLKEMTISNSSNNSSINQIMLFLELLKRLDDVQEKSPPVKEKTTFNLQGKKIDKFELKAQLLATAKHSRPASEFEKIRADIVEWFDKEFPSNLRSPSNLPFHEIFYAGSYLTGMEFNIYKSARYLLSQCNRELGYCSLDSTANSTYCQNSN